MHNTHKCTVAAYGCKKQAGDIFKPGYSCTEMIPESYVNDFKIELYIDVGWFVIWW